MSDLWVFLLTLYVDSSDNKLTSKLQHLKITTFLFVSFYDHFLASRHKDLTNWHKCLTSQVLRNKTHQPNYANIEFKPNFWFQEIGDLYFLSWFFFYLLLNRCKRKYTNTYKMISNISINKQILMNVPVNRVKITGPAVMMWTCLNVGALITLPGWCANQVNKIKTEYMVYIESRKSFQMQAYFTNNEKWQ